MGQTFVCVHVDEEGDTTWEELDKCRVGYGADGVKCLADDGIDCEVLKEHPYTIRGVLPGGAEFKSGDLIIKGLDGKLYVEPAETSR